MCCCNEGVVLPSCSSGCDFWRGCGHWCVGAVLVNGGNSSAYGVLGASLTRL